MSGIASLPRSPARRLVIVLGVCLAIMATGCGGDDGDGYPSEVRVNFMNNCTQTGGTESQCRCAWDAITEEFTYEEFIAIERDLAAGTGGEELVPIIQDCILE